MSTIGHYARTVYLAYKFVVLQSSHPLTPPPPPPMSSINLTVLVPECSPQVHPLCQPLPQLLQVPYATQLWHKEEA